MNDQSLPDVEKVSYQVSRNVLVKIWWKRWMLRPRVLISLSVMVVLMVIFLFQDSGVEIAGYILLGIVITVPFNIYRALAKAIDNDSMWTDRKTLEFSHSGIVTTGPDWKNEWPWKRFKKLSEDADYFYLVLSNANGLASVIPKTAFTPEQQDKFRECAKVLNV